MDKNNIKKIVSRLTESEWEKFKLGKLFVRCRTKEDAKKFIYNCSLHNIKRAYSDLDCTGWEYHEDNTVYHIVDGFLHCCHVMYIVTYYPDAYIVEFNTPICTCNKEDNKEVEKEEYMAANNSTNMDFKQAIRTWDRMCSNFINSCVPCPLHKVCDNVTCREYVCKNPDDAIAVFVKWAAENPEKTIMDDFFEKFPNASRASSGVPEACAKQIGYIKKCHHINCNECWRQPLEETEE